MLLQADRISPKEAIHATMGLLKEKQEINIIRKNARAEAEKWGWTSATQQLEDYYQKIIRPRGKRKTQRL